MSIPGQGRAGGDHFSRTKEVQRTPRAVSARPSSGRRASVNIRGGWIVFFVVFFCYGRVQEAFPFLWPLRLTLVSSVLMVFLIVARGALSWHSLSLFWLSKTFKIYSCFVFVAAISIPFSIYPSFSLSLFIPVFLQIVPLYLIGVGAYVQGSDDFDVVFLSLVTALLALSFVAMFMPTYVDGRVTATRTYDPNDFALCMVVGVSLLFPLSSCSRFSMRMLCYALAALMVYCVYLSQSRGGLIALLVVFLYESTFYGIWRFLRRVGFCIFLVSLLSIFVDTSVLGRFANLNEVQGDYNVHSKSGRVAIWERGIINMFKNPVVGVGIGAFAVADGASQDGGKWSHAHNSFVQVGAELGFPGLVIFLALISSAFKLARPVSPTDWLGRGIRLSLVGFLVGGFFLSWAYQFVLYFILGIAMIRERLIATSAYNPLLLFGARKQKIVVNKARVH